MNAEDLKPGKIIEGPFWKEPVEILSISPLGDALKLRGVGSNTKKFYECILDREKASRITPKPLEKYSFSCPGEDFFLGIESNRIRFSYLFDPFLAVNVSQIDPLPHQIEAVYHYILKHPVIRFLLADDPGAGKTIMAGLIIKELWYRGIIKNALIVCPGHLKLQWKRELKEKFGETFIVIDRSVMNASWGENVWEERNKCITSMDFIRQDDVAQTLSNVKWDLVIVDEAHKMAAYRRGGNKVKKSDRYRIGEVLSRNSNHLLFLTATPHKGDPENFRLFLDLLQKGFFARSEQLLESIQNRDNPLFLRRLKEDLKDFEGKPIFPPRHVKTIKYRLNEPEMILYNDLSRYVINEYNKALKQKKTNIAFALTILQRRLASSVRAARKSLERRKKRLEGLYRTGSLLQQSEEPLRKKEDWEEELEDLPEEERWKLEEKLEQLTIAGTLEELKREISILEDLVNKAKEIEKQEVEKKLTELKKVLDSEEIKRGEKIIIFTEARDTLEYLLEKIESWGFSVNYIHGGMGNIDERIKAEKIFRDRTQVLVATEAAGEGINLQFCSLMVNYDIPWNPNRLEQRMGRIHRYGQQKEVTIYNLVAMDTREGEVLIKVLDKLKEMGKALGTDRVFNVIGDIFIGVSLRQLIEDAVMSRRSMQEILAELDIKPDEQYLEKVKKALGEGLATRHIDYTRLKEESQKASENRLIPEYIEQFFLRAFKRLGGKVNKRKDGFWHISHVPVSIRTTAEDYDFKNRFGKVLREYPKATFDKDIAFKNPTAEFIAPGHPLLEAIIEKLQKDLSDVLQKGTVFSDPQGKREGLLWFFLGEVRDGLDRVAGRRLFSLHQNLQGGITEVNPSIIWDLELTSDGVEFGEKIKNLLQQKEKVEEKVITAVLAKYQEEIQKRREIETGIKEKYGLRSIKYLIEESDAKLVSYYERKERGKNMDIAIRQEEQEKERLQERLKSLREEIKREKEIILTPPQLLGVALVTSNTKEGKMTSDEEIEKIGMEVAVRFEREEGRIPEDVSRENLGFDIRSLEGGKVVRYIEVKARSSGGSISLTPNEWIKAKRFGRDYWLYIVTDAVKNPALHILQDPASYLKPMGKVEIVHFIVPEAQWKNVAQRI